MRTTRAAGAVARLNRRASSDRYAMVTTGAGLVYLVEHTDRESVTHTEPMPVDAFVTWVDAFGPQVVRRRTKADVAFESQLKPRAPARDVDPD